MVEWDAEIPDFQVLQNEIFKARLRQNEAKDANAENAITA
jgi:uncharacterized protein (UPF0276 family)